MWWLRVVSGKEGEREERKKTGKKRSSDPGWASSSNTVTNPEIYSYIQIHVSNWDPPLFVSVIPLRYCHVSSLQPPNYIN